MGALGQPVTLSVDTEWRLEGEDWFISQQRKISQQRSFISKCRFDSFSLAFTETPSLGEKINTSFVCWAKLIPLWGCIVMQGVLLYSVLKSSRTSCLQFYCPPHSSLMLCNLVCKLAEPNKVKQHLLHSTLRRNHSCSVSCMEPQTTWQVFLSAPQSQLRGKCWGKLLLGDRDQVYMNRNTNTHRHKHTENFNVEVISALSVLRSNLKCFHKI